MRLEEGGVNRKVSGRPRVGLDVDTPFIGIKPIGFEGPLLTETLNLIDDLVSSVVASVGDTLGILVGESRSKAFHHSLRGKVFRRDQLKACPLTVLLLLNEIVENRIML